jgi:hypothetical protein
MNYPWTNRNLYKEIEESIKSENFTQITDIDDFFDKLKNKHIPWYKKLLIKIEQTFHKISWGVYRYFKPCHKPVRKAIPREWCDVTELVLLVNFAIIKEFVEEEMDSVVWDDEERPILLSAGKWLRESYDYITKERDVLLQNQDTELSIASNLSKQERKGLSYHQRYGKVNELEKLIAEKDKKVLLGLAEYREYLWT